MDRDVEKDKLSSVKQIATKSTTTIAHASRDTVVINKTAAAKAGIKI